MRLSFDHYVLDLSRGCLLLNGNEVPLRPKTFAVLRFLVENAGRLVTKDEIFAAVWPNLAVTDDTLVQSIGELRRELGEDGPRLIKTIPRRGYRFDASVTGLAAGDDLVPGAAAPEPAASHAGVQTPSDVSTFAIVGNHFCQSALAADGRPVARDFARWRRSAAASHSSAVARQPRFCRSDIETGRGKRTAGNRHSPIRQSKPRSRSRVFRRWIDAGHDQRARPVFRADRDVVERRCPYKEQAREPGDIARSLAVRYQVEGSVLQTGDRVRVSAQLVDTEGQVLWSARFDEATRRLFALQDKITTQIAGVLAIRVTQIEQRRVLGEADRKSRGLRICAARQAGPAAPGRAPSIVEARALLRRAIELDPNYAAAYAGLAETYHLAAVDGLGGVAIRNPGPRRGIGEQGAQPRRVRSARAHHSRPHPYLPSAIRAGEGGDRARDRRSILTMPMALPGAATS